MADKSKKGKKGTISEGRMYNLLQRYPLNTVFGLLQEVEQVGGDRIDWHEMVKNTSTGITCAREYQMMWRHLAYEETLIDQLDRDAEPMDDDSDLEYEVEAFPAVSREASAEASACVKVLIGSGYPNDSHASNNSTIEAPLTINIPKSKRVPTSSDSSIPANEIQAANISIPVFVQKQPLSSGIAGEKRPSDGASGVNLPSRRRRRSWSEEEDMKLTAAVQKNGERNWANIARWDFKNDRRASELSQRWVSLRKKQGGPKVGTSSQPSETLAAANRSMSFALERGNNMRATSQITTAGMRSQHPSQKSSESPVDRQLGRTAPPKPQMLTNPPYMNRTSNPDSMLKATAVAAGARMGTPADASSLMEAARSQNIVHITTGGGPVMKPSTTSIANKLPSNVHFICNGLAKAPISTYSATKPSQPGEAKQAQNHSIKPAASAVPSPAGTTQVLNVTSENGNAGVSTSADEIKEVPQSIQGANPANPSCCAPVESLPEDRSAASGIQAEEVQKCQTSSEKSRAESTQDVQASVSLPDAVNPKTDDGVASQVENSGKTETDNQITSEETLENPSSNGMCVDGTAI